MSTHRRSDRLREVRSHRAQPRGGVASWLFVALAALAVLPSLVIVAQVL